MNKTGMIPIIDIHSLNNTDFIFTDEMQPDEIYSAVYSRNRFKKLSDLLLKTDRIDDGDFSDMLSNRYFISAHHINDARLAAMAVYFKLKEKGMELGNKIRIEKLSSDEDDDCDTPTMFRIESAFGGFGPFVPADTDNDIIMQVIDSVSYELDFKNDDIYDDKLRFIIFCDSSASSSDISSLSKRLSSIYTGIIIEKDSPEDIENIMEDFFYQKDYDTEQVKQEIHTLSFYTPQDNEYSAVQICRKVISNHLLESPSSRELTPKSFAELIQQLKYASSSTTQPPANSSKSIPELIGLENEMSKIYGILDLLLMEKMRESMGIDSHFDGCHMVFAGPPGTAKTTLARYFAGKLEEFEIIKSADNFKECVKSDIVGKYVGHTAANVDNMFRNMAEMGGGIIFFDEIYSLAEDDSTVYDKEAVTCIIQNMENYRDKVFCIFAGYEDKINGFLSSNPGLRSRIHFTVKFHEYENDTLCSIFRSIVNQNKCRIPDDCGEILQSYFSRLKEMRGDKFGNGREARNLYSNAVQKLATRINKRRSISRKALTTFIREDIEAAAEDIINSELGISGSADNVRKIGF